jgi:proteasome alpha subunit
MPFYVSPEQITKDKADFARKGIARGKSIIVQQCDDGIVFVAENPSRALHKISEIYDRIAFGAAGKYNEFEQLRVAGIRLADTRGYAYDRTDVTGRSLANAYAQTLGAIFTDAAKPYEVELVVAEVGTTLAEDQIYRIAFDGSVSDEQGYVAMGGAAEALGASLAESWRANVNLASAVRVAVAALAAHGAESSRDLHGDQLEVALLERGRPRRCFRRLGTAELAEFLAG